MIKLIKNPLISGKCELKGYIESLCPETGQKDVYQFTISYEPLSYIIEIFSLKDFLTKYNDIKMYQEEITNDIYLTIQHLIKCPLKITLEDNSPGIQLKTEVGN